MLWCISPVFMHFCFKFFWFLKQCTKGFSSQHSNDEKTHPMKRIGVHCSSMKILKMMHVIVHALPLPCALVAYLLPPCAIVAFLPRPCALVA